MRNIPVKFLQNECRHIYNFEIDAYGKLSNYEITDISNVLINKNDSVTKSINEIKSYDYVLFYDLQNSCGMIQEFQLNDKIEFQNNLFTIKTINKVESLGELHHYELGLV